MNNFKISVILPLYNREKSIKRAIESILNQSGLEYIEEIIVVDDSSTDESYNIVNDMNKKYNIISLYKTKQNSGAAAARNIGIYNSSSDFIAFLDSDDEWLPDKILKQIKIIYNNPNIDFVYTGINEIYNNKTIVKKAISYNNPLKYLLYWNYIGTTSTALIKKSALLSINGFDEALQSRQDLDLWLRLALNGYKFYAINEPLINMHLDNFDRISNNIYKKISGHEYFINKYKDLLINNPKAYSKNLLRLAKFYKNLNNPIISKEYYQRAFNIDKNQKTVYHYIINIILGL